MAGSDAMVYFNVTQYVRSSDGKVKTGFSTHPSNYA